MNVLDILLLVAAVWFAVVGYRQGFVVGVLSVIGFLGGGLVAVYTLPVIWDAMTDRTEVGTTAAVVAVVVVIVCASVGQALTTHLGNKLRRYITWSPARALDATGGALVNVVAMLLVAWLIGSALAGTTLPTLGKEVRGSKVLLGVSRALPAQADTWFADFSSVLAQNGFPQVFSPFSDEPIKDVQPPDPALANGPVALRAQRSIVKVTGTAQSCGKVLEGTGFVFADRRVMTNAHVVGGVDAPRVQIGGEGRKYDAKVVLYDWKRDIAVLDVPDLRATSLRFTDQDASGGDGAIVAGFPENGAYDVRAARVRGRITANGPDIYHRGTVRRDVYSLYATVRQGNSGGPLLTPAGKVYGVVFAKSLDDADTGYALTSDEIRADIERGRTANEQVDTDSCAL
ncbi:MarP family serine protease [Streptomyces echinatus]|uniref:MarP family serine protease n=1 Tax=Streptomyces echinatus TaxID=67293 RepID=UPI001614D432|nr:MarP family serine protease [Streptomyces echinatus]